MYFHSFHIILLLYMKQCIILSMVKPFKCCLQTTCAVHAGASGGGVFNTQGQLVAMVICNSRLCSLRVNYFSSIALWVIEIKFSIARMKF